MMIILLTDANFELYRSVHRVDHGSLQESHEESVSPASLEGLDSK